MSTSDEKSKNGFVESFKKGLKIGARDGVLTGGAIAAFEAGGPAGLTIAVAGYETVKMIKKTMSEKDTKSAKNTKKNKSPK